MKKKPKTKAGKAMKMEKVMHEKKMGTLKSSSGAKVTSRKQAIAIGLSESGQSNKAKDKAARMKAKKTGINSRVGRALS